jgi:hypothetical protein
MFSKPNTFTLILSFSLQFAVEIIHNMRTIKQLTVEKEVLRQYSHLIYQVFMLVLDEYHSNIEF